MKDIELGFLENTNSHHLLSHFFPSKAGGKPAWLSLDPLPDISNLSCQTCMEPLVFLLQIYAPLSDSDTQNKECFHRSLFVFICKNSKCYIENNTNCIAVYRSQLRKNNKFYSDIPSDENNFNPEEEYPKAESYNKLCSICGCLGSKMCSGCNKVTYCSRSHQIFDWKNGHKSQCKSSGNANTKLSDILFPESEIVMDVECLKNVEDQEHVLSEEEGHSISSDTEKFDEKDLTKMALSEENCDKTFLKFKKIISEEPDQILRFQRNGSPLIVTDHNKPEFVDVPSCTCGSERTFEFQIMPQLLNHLELNDVNDSIDWASLYVFTCKESCSSDNYMKEVVFKQNFNA